MVELAAPGTELMVLPLPPRAFRRKLWNPAVWRKGDEGGQRLAVDPRHVIPPIIIDLVIASADLVLDSVATLPAALGVGF